MLKQINNSSAFFQEKMFRNAFDGSGTHFHIRIAYQCRIHINSLINRAWEEKVWGWWSHWKRHW